MTSFQTYLLGFVILIIGLAIAAFLLGAPRVWIGVGVVILIGIAIISAASHTRSNEPPGSTRPRY